LKTFIIGSGHTALALAAEMPDATRYSLGGAEALRFDEPCTLIYAVDVNVDAAEDNPVDALHQLCNDPCALFRRQRAGAGGRFVYVSSGCVWAGPYNAVDEPFTVDDTPTPRSVYGHLRVLGEHMLQSVARDWPAAGANDDAATGPRAAYTALLILRPRLLFSSRLDPDNALCKFLKFKRLSMRSNSMTSMRTLARAAVQLGATQFGAKHCVYDLGAPSPYDVASALHKAGFREQPEPMDAPASRAVPRVDVVMFDSTFETATRPPWAIDEFLRLARLYKAQQ